MADLYLFDGYNLLHAGGFTDARELRDALASYVAVRGARGIVVFDGLGDVVSRGPLEVRYAPNADAMLERLAAEHRRREHVVLVTSDATLKQASGIEVAKVSSAAFAGELRQAPRAEEPPRGLAGKLDDETRAPPGKAASRRVSGSIANRACALCGTLLDSSQPKGEGSVVQGRNRSPENVCKTGGNHRGRPHRNRTQVTAEGSTRA